MPRRPLWIASICAALLAALSACNAPDGTTPSCTNDVTAKGIDPTVKDGCNPFPTCAADPSNPATCCKDLKGSDLATCLYAFGVGSIGGAGGTGGASTSSGGGKGGTSTSAGGAASSSSSG